MYCVLLSGCTVYRDRCAQQCGVGAFRGPCNSHEGYCTLHLCSVWSLPVFVIGSHRASLCCKMPTYKAFSQHLTMLTHFPVYGLHVH